MMETRAALESARVAQAWATAALGSSTKGRGPTRAAPMPRVVSPARRGRLSGRRPAMGAQPAALTQTTRPSARRTSETHAHVQAGLCVVSRPLHVREAARVTQRREGEADLGAGQVGAPREAG